VRSGLAKKLGITAPDVRKRNLVRPDDLPYTVGTLLFGNPLTYENVDCPRALDCAIDQSGYSERLYIEGNGDRVAYGLGCGVETAGLVNYESAKVRVDPDGTVTVASGISSQGQGQHTTYAQVCAETLGIPLESINV
jgi:aerobic carbon-monoxide dehydrogenase large subunit